jgi:alpha-L-rhamnosidase
VSNWRREGGKLRLEVSIPVNTTATVYMPSAHNDAVTESGQPVAKATGIRFLRSEKGAAVYEVGSGSYVLEAPFSPGGTTQQ